jgi:hypothetical protein
MGWTSDKLELTLQAAARWTMKAWDASVRDGGCSGQVYEDHCERRDPQFYPRRALAA